MDSNCVCPPVCGFLSLVNTLVLYHPCWLNPLMSSHGSGGLTIHYTRIFKCEKGQRPSPVLFKGPFTAPATRSQRRSMWREGPQQPTCSLPVRLTNSAARELHFDSSYLSQRPGTVTMSPEAAGSGWLGDPLAGRRSKARPQSSGAWRRGAPATTQGPLHPEEDGTKARGTQ